MNSPAFKLELETNFKQVLFGGGYHHFNKVRYIYLDFLFWELCVGVMD